MDARLRPLPWAHERKERRNSCRLPQPYIRHPIRSPGLRRAVPLSSIVSCWSGRCGLIAFTAMAQSMSPAQPETFVLGAFHPGTTRLPNSSWSGSPRAQDANQKWSRPFYSLGIGPMHLCSTPGRSRTSTRLIRDSSRSTVADGRSWRSPRGLGSSLSS